MASTADMTSEQERDLKATTDKEVELGHLAGPFSEQQMTEHLGTTAWLLNPRFILYQRRSPTRHGSEVCLCSGGAPETFLQSMLGDPKQSPGGVG